MRKNLLNEFVDEWNSTNKYKMKIMSDTTAVADGVEDLWVAEDNVFEIEVKHYILDSTDIYTD
jgi:hypothetical protein